MDKKNKKISRRKFIQGTGGFLAGAAGLYLFLPGLRSWPKQAVESANMMASHYLPMGDPDAAALRQIITKDSSSARMIMWQSELAEENALAEFRRRGSDAVIMVPATEEAFSDAGMKTHVHTARLTGLESGTAYEYRIGCGDKRGEWHGLHTDNGGPFKALLFPDSQSNDYSDWENVAISARRANPDADFFINMGDMVDNGQDYSQWRAWFDGAGGLLTDIPVAPVPGNHETYDLNWKVRLPEAYLKLFSLPENGIAGRENQFYSFDYGPVHFIVLNTQIDETEAFQPGMLAAEKEWFEADLRGSMKRWNVVLMHKDVLTYEIRNRQDRKAGISDIGREFMPLFDRYGIDVVLTAHLHTYRRRARLYDFQPDERGPLYIVTGVAGNVRYPKLWVDHPFDRVVAPQPETNNYMTLEASADSLRLASFLPSGAELDRVEIRK